jgi:5-methyltetrahydropteroyltriglutamate--homocysteine methyltransferase
MIRAKEAGQQYDREAFALRVRNAVAEVVQKQIAAGVDVISDGEEGKPGFANYVRDRLTGIIAREGVAPPLSLDRQEFPDFPAAVNVLGVRRMVCVGPLGWKDKGAVQTDIANFKAALQGVRPAEAFLPAVSPGTLAQNVTNEHYRDEEAFLYAVADVMKEEYKAITDAGLLLQIDSPDLAMGRAGQYQDKTLAEYRKIIGLRVEVLNHALAGIPPEKVRHHICWGNGEAPHNHDVELKDIVDILLKSHVGALYVEGANPRHQHEWKVFKDVKPPEGMAIIAGVIDTKTNYIEHPEVVADRIVNYASVLGRENVMAATDCGFGTNAGRDRVVPSVTWAKLKTMAEGAELATKRLWPQTRSRGRAISR